MTVLRIHVNKNILKWVKHVSDGQLGEDSLNLLTAWISGDKEPTVRQLKTMSDKTHLPFGYFFLSEIPDEDISILKFRTIDNHSFDHPSRDLLDVINDVEAKQIWLREYRQNEGYSINGFNGGFKAANNSIKDIFSTAKSILSYLGLDQNWNINVKADRFKLLRHLLDQVGVTTICSSYAINSTRRKLNPSEFRAFALSDKYAPFIFVNSNDSYKAMLFSLVHELVHIWFGSSETYNDDYKSDLSVTEQQINRISEHILFPDVEFINQWNMLTETSDISKVFALAPVYGTSPLSIAIKARHLKLVSQESVDQVKLTLEKQFLKNKEIHKNKHGGPSFYRVKASHLGSDFIEDVNRSVKSWGGHLLYWGFWIIERKKCD